MDIRDQKNSPIQAGDIVYVIVRNPHAQDVANIQEAAVVRDPEQSGHLNLFLYETHYPLNDEIAVYRTEEEAEQAYQYYFGSSGEGEFYG
ncbi:transcriptional regulator SplA domain-containing protein [Paludifilum halophilum]|uniref:Transcriptional regulator SplA n=1 Tax=Paludifilum halophilum TaxID=1642702 RepID=A0A235B1K2_9BACL|nr:transcriptional regulator SplA domain-containing protein [Paludifilum halophilum]OYD06186.1 transcriptional regulator SplA [Paludifilum halophilum]